MTEMAEQAQVSTLPAVWIVPAPHTPAPGRLLGGAEQAQRDDVLMYWWSQALDAFLDSKQAKSGSRDTRRSYESSVRMLMEFSGKRPWEVTGADVIEWQKAMRANGLAETTINLRLAGVSSFYKFCATKYSPYIDPNTGREFFLINYNPIDRAERAKINPYDKADGMSTEEMLAMLRRIDRSTVVGLRNFGLVLTYLCTGKRSAEIRNLKWGDITHKDDVHFYRWEGKGGKSGTSELLAPAYDAIVAYLKAAKRLETIQPEDYIFIATSDVAARLPNVREMRSNQPLTGSMVNRIVKQAARRAGLDEKRVHTHVLRHTAADMRLAISGDLLGLKDFMGHSSSAITEIYLSKRKRDRDPLWAQVGAMFDFD